MTLLDEIKKGEGEKMEFKAELPDDSMRYVDSIIAFSNGAGGKLIIGIGNTGNIIGVPWEELDSIENTVASAVTDLCRPQIIPHFHKWNLEGKNVLEIRIHEGNKRPYHIKGKKEETSFIRIGPSNRQPTTATIHEMELRTLGRSYDGFRSEEEGLDEDKIKKLCEDLTGYGIREFTRKDLINLQVIKKDADGEYPTIAYSLLVGSNNSSYVTDCACFKGTTKTYFLDKETFNGPIYEQIDKALSFILRHINIGLRLRKDSIAHEDIYELPKDAIRESLANAMVHRNYIQIEGRTMVAVFDDRVEVMSPGTLPPGLALEDALAGGMISRNPILAETFRTSGTIEGWGSGMGRMVEMCRSYGLKDPSFEKLGTHFKVTFHRPKEFDPAFGHGEAKKNTPSTNGSAVQKFNDELVLEAIKNGKGQSIESLVKETKLSRASVERAVQSLKELGIVKRTGNNRNGYYEII